ncbi:hypothetical protein E2C01_082549 [Portunus trituberculatus]|uniref:Uncharacterized protein n=1 Tax=Portunus trituberculatus TaxID=210409 RepID=A0A5B7J1Z9_PORTR|nr:hypothetical protein [Portunus trituberculatus]
MTRQHSHTRYLSSAEACQEPLSVGCSSHGLEADIDFYVACLTPLVKSKWWLRPLINALVGDTVRW